MTRRDTATMRTYRRFNPFNKLSCKYGAPMGRHGADPSTYDGTSKLFASHCGGDGFYDRGGAYWGHSKVYAVWTRGGAWCTYVDAFSVEGAIRFVIGLQELTSVRL